MATAVIRIDQAAHPTVPIGVAGRSRDDIVASSAVTLRNVDDQGVRSHRWEILDQPDRASPVQLSNPNAAAPTFTPVAVGTYRIRLTVNDGLKGQVDTRLVVIRDSNGNRCPAAGERSEANWIDPQTSSPNVRGWATDVCSQLGAGGGQWVELADIDLTAESNLDVTGGTGDGNYVIDSGHTLRFLNSQLLSNNVEIINGTGLLLACTGGEDWVPNNVANQRDGPQMAIRLDSLLADYSPARYAFRFFARGLWTGLSTAFEGMGMGVADDEGLGTFMAAVGQWGQNGDMICRHAQGTNFVDRTFSPAGTPTNWDNFFAEIGAVNEYVVAGVLDNATSGNLSTDPIDYELSAKHGYASVASPGPARLTTAAEMVMGSRAASGDGVTFTLTRLVIQALDLGAPA